jgi:hypothetical protein
MSKSASCSDCGNSIPPSAERCPHCARPGLFPNVRAAGEAEESAAVDRRYQLATQDATARGAENSLKNFETAIASSVAVIGRSENDLQRLATSDNEIYATYYKLIEAGLRLPGGDKWDVLRALADDALFPGYKEHIRFAALSLDGIGLSNYGDCSVVLNTDMIAHRASVFEENSILFMKHNRIKLWEADNLPKGHRATWENRGKLCVAKLAGKIEASTQTSAFSGLLLQQGATSEEDEFVEVHIWGPMTVRTIGEVAFKPRAKRAPRAIIKALGEKLVKAGVRIK